MSAMTILSVSGTPVSAGQVRKTVRRVSTGRCNPHRATQTSLVCIGIASPLLRNVPAEARARPQRCSRLTSPMIRLLMGICQHRRPVMSRGGLCQAAPAAPSTPRPGRYGRMGWLSATAGRALQIRRYAPPRSSLQVVVGRESTPDPGERTLPQTRWTDRQQVPSADSR